MLSRFVLKSRDITLPTKVHLVKAMVFPVVMYGCESWTVKKAECRWIDAFELWCWRRLLRVPWLQGDPASPSKGNQSWIFIGRTDAEAETPILWPPDAKKMTPLKRTWCWERLKVGGEGEDKGWDGWIASPTQWTWVWVSSRSWWWTWSPGMLQSLGSWLSDWTDWPTLWDKAVFLILVFVLICFRGEPDFWEIVQCRCFWVPSFGYFQFDHQEFTRNLSETTIM